MALHSDAASSAPCVGASWCVGQSSLDTTLALQDVPNEQEAKREDEPAKPDPAKQAKGAGGGQHDEPSGHGQTDTPCKKQRVLRELHSDSDGTDQETDDDKQAAVLQELVNRIKQAAKAGLFVSSDAARSDTVLAFLVQADCSESADDDGWRKDRVYQEELPAILGQDLHGESCVQASGTVHDDLQ